MNIKELDLKVRINKKNGQLNINLPKKCFSKKELDSIQETKSIKILMKNE